MILTSVLSKTKSKIGGGIFGILKIFNYNPSLNTRFCILQHLCAKLPIISEIPFRRCL